MRRLISHLHHTIRRLAKSPGFTIAAVLVLGLGIGANTAIFSLINGVLLRPLPYPHSEQLVLLFQPFRTYNEFPFDYPDFVDYAAAQHSFQQLTAIAPGQVNLTGRSEPQRIDCAYVTASFFEVFGRPFITLGAESTNILRLALRRGLAIVGVGLLTGLAVTLAILPLVQASLYGISAYDPVAIMSGTIVLTLTAVAACLVPALRATRTNPIIALRE